MRFGQLYETIDVNLKMQFEKDRKKDGGAG